MKTKHFFAGRLALVATAFIWGTSFVVLKSTLDSMGTLWVLAIRFTVSALLLALLSGRRLFKMPKHIMKGSFLMGVCLAAAYIVQTFGLKYTTPGKNAFLTATYVVLVPFFSWICYKKKPGLSNILAGVICICGIGLVSVSGSEVSEINIGDILTLISGVFYAVQIIVMERCVGEGDALPISTVEFAAGAVICLAGALIFEAPPSAVPASAWLSIGYLSVMCTAVCYYLQAWGMQYTPAPTAAVIMVFEAVFGALISLAAGQEEMSFRLFAGFALIFAAVLISEAKPGWFGKKKNILTSDKKTV